MNPFDDTVIRLLNRIAQDWPTLDSIIVAFTGIDLLKGGVIMGLYWWAWFPSDDDRAKNAETRRYLLSGLAAGIAAELIARGLAYSLPFRVRPLFEQRLQFIPPHGAPSSDDLLRWSSFPSDHAVLFFALAAGLLFANYRLGLVAMAYVGIAICLPRIYVGLHWPTDILAGAAVGIGCAWVAARTPIRTAVSRPALLWRESHPGPFHAALFLLTLQLATLFNDARNIGYDLVTSLRHLVG